VGTLRLSLQSLNPLLSFPDKTSQEGAPMDDYQEELLEYRAAELDPLEPADDATEL
jgi:hypothetical protein